MADMLSHKSLLLQSIINPFFTFRMILLVCMIGSVLVHTLLVIIRTTLPPNCSQNPQAPTTTTTATTVNPLLRKPKCSIPRYNERLQNDGSRTTGEPTLETLEVCKDHTYGDGTCKPKHSKKRLKEILTRWMEVTSRHNITTMMTWGSLLGVWRDGDVIPWDTDIDVFTLSRDNELLNCIQDGRGWNTHSEDFHLVLDIDWRIKERETLELLSKPAVYMILQRNTPHFPLWNAMLNDFWIRDVLELPCCPIAPLPLPHFQNTTSIAPKRHHYLQMQHHQQQQQNQ